MINEERIVPVTKTDLLTLYGNTMKLAGMTVSNQAADAPGVFVYDGAATAGNLIADEPVKSFDLADATSGVVYFIPAYDYEGFKVGGVAVASALPDGVVKDADLCKATLSSGAVTVAKVGF